MRIVLSFAALMMLAGCQPNHEPIKSTNTVLTAPTPHVTREVVTSTDNILINGSFETRDANGQPVGWVVFPAGAVMDDPRVDYDAFDGQRTALIQCRTDEFATLNQYLKLRPEDAGRTLHISAQGRSPVDRAMYLSLEYKENGANRTAAERKWPVSPDNWHPVAISARIPENADPGTIRVRIVCAKLPGYSIRIDDVRAEFAEPAPR